jgi:raffinose/stachyose/melibiose transport system substrate-binding protein
MSIQQFIRGTRIILGTVFFMTVILVFSSCNGGSSDKGKVEEKRDVTLVFRTWNPHEEAFAPVRQLWDAKNTGIKLELINITYADHVQSLKINVASGSGPDIYGIQVGAIMKEFQEFTLDVVPKAKETWGNNWESKFLPLYMSQVKGDLDSYYGLPLGGGYAGHIWADNGHFDKYGLKKPSNYNELLEVTKAFRSKGAMPLLHGGKDNFLNLDLIISIASDINAEKFFNALAGKVPFTDPDIVKSLTLFKSLFDNGIVQDGALGMAYRDARDLFGVGNGGPMLFVGAWYINSTGALKGRSFDVFTIDWNMDNKPAPVAPTVDVVVSINKDGKYIDETWQFYSWLVDEGAKIMIDDRLQYFPAKVGETIADTNFSEEVMLNLNKLLKMGQDNAVGYREITYPRLKEVIADQLKAIVLDESTVEKAAEIIEAASKAEKR